MVNARDGSRDGARGRIIIWPYHHLATNEDPQPQLDSEFGFSVMAKDDLIISST